MISLEDFTTFPPGTDVPEGVLAICPRCGRAGAERSAGRGDRDRVVTHVQASELLPDGLLVSPVDRCVVAHA